MIPAPLFDGLLSALALALPLPLPHLHQVLIPRFLVALFFALLLRDISSLSAESLNARGRRQKKVRVPLLELARVVRYPLFLELPQSDCPMQKPVPIQASLLDVRRDAIVRVSKASRARARVLHEQIAVIVIGGCFSDLLLSFAVAQGFVQIREAVLIFAAG